MCIMPCQGKHGSELCQANSALKHKLAFQVYIWCKIYSKKYDFKSGLFFTPLSVFFTYDFIIRKRIAFTFLRLLKGNNICIRYPFSPPLLSHLRVHSFDVFHSSYKIVPTSFFYLFETHKLHRIYP